MGNLWIVINSCLRYRYVSVLKSKHEIKSFLARSQCLIGKLAIYGLSSNQFNVLDISIKRWPVRGRVNHLVYKNIYCAMCNGVDPYDNVDLQAQTWFGRSDEINSPIPRVEWWPAKIECPNDSIDSYLEDNPDHTKMVNFIAR